jgi:hypothetical protein
MKVLELYAGSRSVGKVAEKMGHQVCSVDVKAFDGIDLVMDIEHLTIKDLPFLPDMVWASPPCTTYSMAAISHHRPTNGILSDFANKSDRLVMNTLKLIKELGCIYYIENPRAKLRKMPFMVSNIFDGLPSASVCYCRYGDNRMKPTDIFSNNIRSLFNEDGWQPRSMCWNGNKKCHHEPAPRGSRTGTQGLKNNYERSKIPVRLCIDILRATELKLWI